MICPSCGAEYADWARACPYCGTVNENADEQAYLEHMEQLRGRLDTIDEEAETHYRKGVKGMTKKVLVKVGIALLAVIAVIAAIMGISKAREAEGQREWEEQLKWEEENFPILDEVYATGDYDAVIEKGYVLTEGTDYYLADWSHYWFIFDCYYAHNSIETWRNEIETGRHHSHDMEYDTYVSLELVSIPDSLIEHYLNNTDVYETTTLTETEAELVRNWREDARDFMCNSLGFTEAEIDKLITECYTEYGYVSSTKCSEMLKKMGKIE